MFQQLCLFVVAITVCSLSNGQVGIGTNSPAASAKLEIASTTQGFLPPRMTSTQRNAISSPVQGLMVYQTDATEGLYYYTGSAWIYIINATTNVLPIENGGTGVSTSTGTGSVVLSTSPSLTTPSLGAATATSIITPIIMGGSSSTQTLTYKPNSGFGATGADHIFQVGGITPTEAMRIVYNGNVGIGDFSSSPPPSTKLEVKSGQTNNSGLRLTNLTSASPTSSGVTLGVDSIGNVVTVNGSSSSPSFGSASLGTGVTIYADSNHLLTSITINTTGTYLINYTMRVQPASPVPNQWAVGYLALADNNTAINGTEILGAFPGAGTGGDPGGNYSGTHIMTINSVPTTIYFRARAFGGTMNFMADANGYTKISYVKVTP